MRKVLILCALSILLILSGCSGESEQKEEATSTAIGQSITFGDYSVSADSYSLSDGVLTISLTVSNNSANGKTIDSIIGLTADQAGTVLSGTNNTYDGVNTALLNEYLDPGQSKTIDLQYSLPSEDNVFTLSLFNDSSLGLSDQNLGAGMDIQINPADGNVDVQTYSESEQQ